MPDQWSDNSTHNYRLRGIYQSKIMIYKLDHQAILIGRDSKGKIVIDHPSVSKHHAMIERDDKNIFITDLESNNGTFINGEKLDPNVKTELNPGDRIRVGDRRFTLYSEAEPSTENTVAMQIGAKHPIGPVKAFPPDLAETAQMNETAYIDAQVLLAEADNNEQGDPDGPWLQVKEGKKYTLPISLSLPEFLIGRGKKSHMRLDDKAASKVHLRIVRRKGRFYCYDDNSLNGTYVNGEKIRGTALRDGDLILIGQTVILFNDPDSPKSLANTEQTARKIASIAFPTKLKNAAGINKNLLIIGLGILGLAIAIGTLFYLFG